MSGWLKRRRSHLDDDLTRRGLAHTFSLARYTLHHATQKLIDAHATGVCLDVGSGRAPYRDLLAESASGWSHSTSSGAPRRWI